MIATILLFSDDPAFSGKWRPAFEELGCDVRATSPENLPVEITRGGAAVFDLSWEGYDEDEILTALGFAASQDTVVAADLINAGSAPDLDEVCAHIRAGDLKAEGLLRYGGVGAEEDAPKWLLSAVEIMEKKSRG